MWVGMAENTTSNLYLTSGQVWSISIQNFKNSLYKTLTNVDAMVAAIALHVQAS